jgi:DNA repair protein RadC
LKRLPTSDRPREKLERLGAHGLGDNELLALVIGHGLRGRGALDLANDVLHTFGGVHALTRRGPNDLRRVHGLGGAKAARVLAAVELGRRTVTRDVPDRTRFASAGDVAAFLAPRFGAAAVERLGVMLLDIKCRFLKVSPISSGTIDSSYADPRDVFREAILEGASFILLFHNHPSGDPTPSPDDHKLTDRFFRAGKLVGVELLDHIILADNRYYSYRETRRLSDPPA